MTIVECPKAKADAMNEEMPVMRTEVAGRVEVDEMMSIAMIGEMNDEGEMSTNMTVAPDITLSMIIETEEAVDIEQSVMAEIMTMIIETRVDVDDTRESAHTHPGQDLHDHHQGEGVATLMTTNADIGARLKLLNPRGDLIQSQDRVGTIIITQRPHQVAIITTIHHPPQVVTIAITTTIVIVLRHPRHHRTRSL